MAATPREPSFEQCCVDALAMLERWGYAPRALPALERPIPCALESLDRRRLFVQEGDGLALLLDPILTLQRAWQTTPRQAQRLPHRAAFRATAFRAPSSFAPPAAAGRPRRERPVLGGVLIGTRGAGALVELLAVACECLRRFVPDFTVRAGHLGVLRAMLEKRGFGYRLSRLLEENVPLLRDASRLGALREQLAAETGEPGTEAFYEKYTKLVEKAGDAPVMEVFKGLLSTLDIESYAAEQDLQAFLGRLLEKAAYQRDCRAAGEFLDLMERHARDEAAADDRAALEKLIRKEGAKAGLRDFAKVAEALDEVGELIDADDLDLCLALVPQNMGGYYSGAAFRFERNGRRLGHGGEVVVLSADGAEALESCFAFTLELDALGEARAEAGASEDSSDAAPAAIEAAAGTQRLRVFGLGDDNQAYAREVWWRLFWELPEGQVELDAAGRSLKRSLQAAVAAGATHLVILGDEEREKGRLTVKRLADEEQRTVDFEDAELLEFLFPAGERGEFVGGDGEVGR